MCSVCVGEAPVEVASDQPPHGCSSSGAGVELPPLETDL